MFIARVGVGEGEGEAANPMTALAAEGGATPAVFDARVCMPAVASDLPSMCASSNLSSEERRLSPMLSNEETSVKCVNVSDVKREVRGRSYQ